MDFFENRYYRIQKFFMQLIGYWPEERPVTRLIKVIVIFGFIFSFINVGIFAFFTEKITLDHIIDVIPTVLSCCIGIVKYIIYLVDENLLKHILTYIKNAWNDLTDETEIEIFQEIAEDARNYVILVISLCACVVVCLLLVDYTPIIFDFVLPLNESRPRIHLFKAEYFVDQDEYFYPIMLHMQVCISLATLVIAGSDALTLTILFHISGMFAITGHRLQYAFTEESMKADEVNDTRIFCRRLVRAVEYHRKTTQFLQFMTEKLVVFYLIQLILIVLILTGFLLHLHIALMTMEDVGAIMMDLFRLGAHFVVAFFNILPAQRIFDYSEDLLIKSYRGCWYRAPLKAQKFLLFIMQRTMEPSKVTAGNLIDMTFETFSSIVQMTISYFTLIHSIQQ